MPALRRSVILFITNKDIDLAQEFAYNNLPMKDGGREVRCEMHNLLPIKIETNTRRALCEKCLSQNEQERRQRLEIERFRLHKAYLIDLNELKEAKKQTDKLVELFQSRNMNEAKKLINKSSPDVQRLVEALIDKEVREANKQLRQAAEAEVEKWKSLDGKSFGGVYLEFQEEQPKITRRLLQLKEAMKQQIADKLKAELRTFYSELFEF